MSNRQAEIFKKKSDIYLAIRKARDYMTRTEYNKIMSELVDVSNFQESMSNTDKLYNQLMEAVNEWK